MGLAARVEVSASGACRAEWDEEAAAAAEGMGAGCARVCMAVGSESFFRLSRALRRLSAELGALLAVAEVAAAAAGAAATSVMGSLLCCLAMFGGVPVPPRGVLSDGGWTGASSERGTSGRSMACTLSFEWEDRGKLPEL